MHPSLLEPRPSAASAAASAVPRAASALLQQCLGLVATELAQAEAELARLLQSSISVIPEVGGHLAFAGGKRFRPLLTLLSARAAGLRDTGAITIAAVAELLHTATLLHDDVIDDGEFRRGRPAARMGFGNGMAVLTGDYCLARALQAVAHLGKPTAVRTMADAVTQMAEGEVAQLHAAGDFSLDRDRYYRVIERKTAALIAWCSSVAELVSPPYVEPLRRFGLELGYAFQIADDLIDARPAGAPAGGEAGKEPGQDLRDGKLTLPLIVACETDPSLRDTVQQAMQAGPPMSAAACAAVLAQVAHGPALAETTRIARGHADAALEALAALPESEARTALAAVTEFVIARTS